MPPDNTSNLFLEVSYAEVLDRGFLHRGGAKGLIKGGGTARRAEVQKMVEVWVDA